MKVTWLGGPQDGAVLEIPEGNYYVMIEKAPIPRDAPIDPSMLVPTNRYRVPVGTLNNGVDKKRVLLYGERKKLQ